MQGIYYLLSALIAAATAIYGVRLALDRFRKEKWWEKKHGMYMDIFQVIQALRYACEDKIGLTYRKHPVGHYLPDLTAENRKWQEVSDLYDDERDKLQTFTTLSEFQLSEESALLLHDYGGHGDFASHGEEAKYLGELMRNLQSAAKRDLKIAEQKPFKERLRNFCVQQQHRGRDVVD